MNLTLAEPAEPAPAGIGSNIQDQAVLLVRRTTQAQGLPFFVEDPAVLGMVAALVEAQRHRPRATLPSSGRSALTDNDANDRSSKRSA